MSWGGGNAEEERDCKIDGSGESHWDEDFAQFLGEAWLAWLKMEGPEVPGKPRDDAGQSGGEQDPRDGLEEFG